MEEKILRRRNFTYSEKRRFLAIVEKYKDILENKTLTAHVNRQKSNAWDEITQIFNCSSDIIDKCSKKQLSQLYSNMQKTARRNKVRIKNLLENTDPPFGLWDSSVTHDGYDPIDKSLLQIIPLSSSSDSENIIRTIKSEVLEDDHTDNSPCIVSSNCSDSALISTPSNESVLLKQVFDIIENSSNSTDCAVTSTPCEKSINKKVQEIVRKRSNFTDCAVTSTPYEESINKKVQEIVNKCPNTNETSCSAATLEKQTISITDEEVQCINEQASNSHPTSTTTPLGEQRFSGFRKKKREPISIRAADARQIQTMARLKQIEEHELIKKKLRLEISSQIESEKRAEAQHKYIMERMKREDEQSEKLYAAKLRALEAKARYFENKMDAK